MSPWDPVVLKSDRLASLNGGELLALMKRLAAAERTLSVYALAQLAEIQRRKLYEDAGFSTMFAYCLGELGYSEGNACRRLRAAEAAGKYPETLSLVKSGSLTICALSLIAKHLTRENCAEILKRIEGKSVRVVERLAAELAPMPDTRDMIRKRTTSAPACAVKKKWISAVAPPPDEPLTFVPTAVEPSAVLPPPATPAAAEASIIPPHAVPPLKFQQPAVEFPQKIMPRALDRVQFSFTGSEELRRVVERCRELLGHKCPAGRLEDIFLELGRTYLKLKDPELLPLSRPKQPRANETRAIPRWVRSKVYRRDEGRCTFRGSQGRRCEARRGLEYDHVRPWARGGRSDDPGNIRLLCRAHNGWAARAAGLA